MRQILGGSPQATEADPDAAAAGFARSPEMQAMFELLKADQDGAQGEGYWREYLRLAFHRTTRSPGYTFEDLGEIAAPTLILVGDRDQFCTRRRGGHRVSRAEARRAGRGPGYRPRHHPGRDRLENQLPRAPRLTAINTRGKPTMTVIKVEADSTLPPECLLHAAHDFSDRRESTFPAVSVNRMSVHEMGQLSADVTEGTRAGPIVNWERCRYDWSTLGRVIATDSNVYASPGSKWEITATPNEMAEATSR
jgi:hypothetical protein